MMEIVDHFCYLGDSLNSEDSRFPHCYVSKNCMGEILTAIAFVNIYKTYIRPVLLYESECWAPVVSDILKLQRNDRAMLR